MLSSTFEATIPFEGSRFSSKLGMVRMIHGARIPDPTKGQEFGRLATFFFLGGKSQAKGE